MGKKKIKFSKIAVSLMYLNIIGMFAYVAITKDYPPTAFIVAWFGFWAVQAVATAVLEINKRGHNRQITLTDAVVPYLNQENCNALIEHFIGIEPTYKKAKVIREAERNE